MKRIVCSIIVLMMLALFGQSGCTSKAVNHRVVEVNRDSNLRATVMKSSRKDEEINRDAFNLYIDGTLYEQSGMLQAAAQSYKNALQHYPVSYQIRYSLAFVLYSMHQPDGALETLSTISPENASVFELRGNCYRQLSDGAQAKKAFLKVVKLDSTNVNAYSYLSGLYRQSNDIDSLIWSYKNIVRINPRLFRVHTEVGKLYGQKRELDSAAASFRNSLKVDSSQNNVLAYASLGEILEFRRHPDSALLLYQRGLKVAPDEILLNRMITNSYVHFDSIPQAIYYARRVVEISPMDKTGIRRLGAILFGADSLQQADSVLTMLLSIGDRHPANYYYLGRIAALDEDYERAKEMFIPLTKLVDSSAQSWLDLGFVYRKLEEPIKEIATYKRGLNHMKDEQSAIQLYFAMGTAFENSGEIDSSVVVFEELIMRMPDHSQALNYLGYMLADRGERLDYAHDLIKKALQQSPENAAYLDSYGWVLYRQGKFKSAAEYLKKAVGLDSDPVIFDHLGDTYQALDNNAAAREWWQKALELSPEDQKIMEKLGN